MEFFYNCSKPRDGSNSCTLANRGVVANAGLFPVNVEERRFSKFHTSEKHISPPIVDSFEIEISLSAILLWVIGSELGGIKYEWTFWFAGFRKNGVEMLQISFLLLRQHFLNDSVPLGITKYLWFNK